MAEAWQRERAELLQQVALHKTEAEVLAKRFRLLQDTLQQQQTVLERYQRELLRRPKRSNSSGPADSGRKRKLDARTTSPEHYTRSAGSKETGRVCAAKEKPPAASLEPPPPKPFQYIEVVRKRDERAALPGHACAECAKYYEALGEEFKGQEDMCSRHRARHEPYNTPEDFWRLSFPDSV